MAYKFANSSYTVLEGVEVIRDHAFYNCTSLRSVSLPVSLKHIGKAPFYLTGLQEITYAGTMDQFKLIKTDVEVFFSEDGLDRLDVYWYQTYDYSGVTTVKCSDGILNLLEL